MNTATKGVSPAAKRAAQIEATQEEQQSMLQAEQLLEGGQDNNPAPEASKPPAQNKPEENQELEPQYPNERARKEAEMVVRQREHRRIETTRDKLEHGMEVSKEDLEFLQAHDRGEFVQKRDDLIQEKAALEELDADQEHEEDDQDLQDQEHEFEEEQESDVNLNKPGIYGDKVVAKVDGELRELTAEQALALVQKNLSADKRLEMASQERQRLQQFEQQLLQQQRELQQRATQPPSQGVDSMPSAEIQDHAKRMINMIEDGDTDAATAELVKLLGRQQQPQISTQDIEREVTAKIEGKMRLSEAERIEAELKGSGQYDDIFADEFAYEQASQNVGLLMSRGEQGSMKELMVKGMEMYRFMNGTQAPAPAKKQADTNQDDRAQRKRTLPKKVQTAGGQKRQAPVKQQEPSKAQKRASVFEQMKNARNQ